MNIRSILVVVVFVFATNAYGQINQVEERNDKHSDCLYFSTKNSKTGALELWNYNGGRYDSLALLIEPLKICERKYPKKKQAFNAFRQTLEDQRKEVIREKKKVIEYYFKTFLNNPDRPPIVDRKKQFPPISETKRAKEFFAKTKKDSEKLILKGFAQLGEEAERLLLVERSRYIVMFVGLTGVFDEPFFRKSVSIDENKRSQIVDKWEATLKDEVEKKQISSNRESFNRIIKVLTKTQISKLERRLGITQKHFFDLLKLSNTARYKGHLTSNRTYRVYIDGRQETFKGIPGLRKLSEKIGETINVRYHVTESKPSIKPPALKELQSTYYSQPVKRSSAINELDFQLIQIPVPWGKPSEFWGPEPSSEQFTTVMGILNVWRKSSNKSRDVRDRIKMNNQLLGEFDEVLSSRQGFGVFRGFFSSHGPVSFFFLPGVKRDFELSDAQLDKLQRVAAEEKDWVEAKQKVHYRYELKVFKEVLSKEEISRLETHLGMPIEKVLRDRTDYQLNVGGNPLSRQKIKFGIKFLPSLN